MSSSAVRTPTRFSPATFFTMAMPSGAAGNGGITASCGQQQQQQRHHQQQCSHAPTTVPSFIGGTPKLRNRQKRGPPMRSQQRQQDATALGKTANGVVNCLKSPNGSTTADKKQLQQQTRSKCQQFGGSAGEAMACVTATTPSRPQQQQQLFRHSIRREQSASAIVIPPRRCNTNNNGFGTVYGTAHPYAGCYTPPSAIFSYEDHEVSPIFAGPKFIESPAAKSLPLPPPQWLEKGFKTQQKREEEAVNALEQDEDAADEGDDEADEQEDNNNDKPLAKQFGGLAVSSSGGRGHSSSSSSESSTSSSSSDGGGGGSGVEQHFNGFIPGSWSPPTAAAAATTASDRAIIVKPVTITPIGIRMDPLHLIAATVMFT